MGTHIPTTRFNCIFLVEVGVRPLGWRITSACFAVLCDFAQGIEGVRPNTQRKVAKDRKAREGLTRRYKPAPKNRTLLFLRLSETLRLRWMFLTLQTAFCSTIARQRYDKHRGIGI